MLIIDDIDNKKHVFSAVTLIIFNHKCQKFLLNHTKFEFEIKANEVPELTLNHSESYRSECGTGVNAVPRYTVAHAVP